MAFPDFPGFSMEEADADDHRIAFALGAAITRGHDLGLINYHRKGHHGEPISGNDIIADYRRKRPDTVSAPEPAASTDSERGALLNVMAVADGHSPARHARLADAILAAGWRRP